MTEQGWIPEDLWAPIRDEAERLGLIDADGVPTDSPRWRTYVGGRQSGKTTRANWIDEEWFTVQDGPWAVRATRIIPAGEAIPPCLDAGWTAPDLLIPWSELATYPNEDLRDLERVAATAGVEISNDQDRALRVHHRRPCVTTLPEPR